jgi:BON domain
MQPIGVYPIHIIVKNGRTMLLGAVDNAADRQLAEVRAREVIGVFEVENSLTVARSEFNFVLSGIKAGASRGSISRPGRRAARPCRCRRRMEWKPRTWHLDHHSALPRFDRDVSRRSSG